MRPERSCVCIWIATGGIDVADRQLGWSIIVDLQVGRPPRQRSLILTLLMSQTLSGTCRHIHSSSSRVRPRTSRQRTRPSAKDVLKSVTSTLYRRQTACTEGESEHSQNLLIA